MADAFDSPNSAPYGIDAAVAAAGNSQATATALTKEFNFVTSATGTSADGVGLPKAIKGRKVTIRNISGATVEAWPFYDTAAGAGSGDIIEDGSADAEAVAPILDDDTITFMAISGVPGTAGTWRSISDAGVIA